MCYCDFDNETESNRSVFYIFIQTIYDEIIIIPWHQCDIVFIDGFIAA